MRVVRRASPARRKTIVRFKQTLLAYQWHYWIVGPRTIHVQWTDSKYKPETAELFTFNEELTKFMCPNVDGSQRIEGMRMEPVAP